MHTDWLDLAKFSYGYDNTFTFREKQFNNCDSNEKGKNQ